MDLVVPGVPSGSWWFLVDLVVLGGPGGSWWFLVVPGGPWENPFLIAKLCVDF